MAIARLRTVGRLRDDDGSSAFGVVHHVDGWFGCRFVVFILGVVLTYPPCFPSLLQPSVDEMRRMMTMRKTTAAPPAVNST
jgi:hypothetical protein